MTALTTHILDTSSGKPAAAIIIYLYQLSGDRKTLLTQTYSNQDGRTDQPLLQGTAFVAGQYELVFAMGDYLKASHANLPDPLFLDDIVIRFGIADPSRHYHVPLLVSPFGYSTYRGS
ncbi:hydroxyisourate hydrolase [Thiosulfativibrio zosterae]|uniref:5-hydroxyisourate hydrolase n=1 Tax=Thiosulfativibrio zosterae TaxID=2675053 RepID=A0A6F8PP57_9GAMM|nr:hydroxyisourate hydrolase [Thiosulfativibrio zosterae]BBP43885.1 5-hydroxyisourate hydrolase [Thiosulfativibrio zosterae]